jgi:hypothetical protein
MDHNKSILRISKFIAGVLFVCCLIGFVMTEFHHPVKPFLKTNIENPASSTCPIFANAESTAKERWIARHFAVDTLPGLMRKGLIHRYKRNASGTFLGVNGNLWKCRSTFFKQSLLREVFVFNKIHGYELSTRIVDSTSGKLYAQISPSAKMDFFD